MRRDQKSATTVVYKLNVQRGLKYTELLVVYCNLLEGNISLYKSNQMESVNWGQAGSLTELDSHKKWRCESLALRD